MLNPFWGQFSRIVNMKKHFKGFLQWAPVSLAILISIIALIVSSSARKDVRALGHLDIRPTLTIRASFKDNNTPTHFRTYNKGPVTATQVKIVGHIFRYYEEYNELKIEATLSDLQWEIGDLQPQKDTIVIFDERLIFAFFDPRLKREHHIFGLRLFYRRTSDMKLFIEQAFYFLNPDGKWVSEINSSLIDSVYAPIKKATSAFPPPNFPIRRDISPSDKLHPIDPNDHRSWDGS